MNKKIIIPVFILAALFIVSCSRNQDFGYGLDNVNKLNEKYGATMTSSPNSMEKITAFVVELEALRNVELNEDQEAFDTLLDYRIHNLEADRYFIEDQQKYGERGTTIMGFGCKGRYRILNSSNLRMMSASAGYKASEALFKFVEGYPEESKAAGLGRKEAMFLNASSVKIDMQAKRDNSIIEKFCPEEEVQRILQEEAVKKKLLGIED